MAVGENTVNYIEIIKATGPYLVAMVGMFFGFFQFKKTIQSQKELAKISKEKDIEIANIQNISVRNMEAMKNRQLAISKLQEVYSPMYAKIESLLHVYCGLVTKKQPANVIKSDLEKMVIDDYLLLTTEKHKLVLAEAIAICQVLQDHKAYELAVKLDFKIIEVLSLFDFTGNSCGSEHIDKLREVQKDLGLLYVSFFYRVANLNEYS
ncbi:hypothetical protein [Ferrimonas aestuarii]|uniref:Uncharacterized protein n=1 Tax=Ferrimonas aestuarii TaxID=2569539 RepID=A0A4U1BTK5_9GAMM|nr:hypothetical protein [Ferrimonas aestuarii]TKB58522.1 hypothetical protein FCL42_01890 [Ferrimonas aestuarii]